MSTLAEEAKKTLFATHFPQHMENDALVDVVMI